VTPSVVWLNLHFFEGHGRIFSLLTSFVVFRWIWGLEGIFGCGISVLVIFCVQIPFLGSREVFLEELDVSRRI